MKKIDVINVGKISGYLKSGLPLLNKYINYETDTIFITELAEKCVYKFGFDHWGHGMTNVDKIKEYNHRKIRTVIKNNMVDISYDTGNIGLSTLFANQPNHKLCIPTIMNVVKNTFKLYDIDALFVIPTEGNPVSMLVNGEQKYLGHVFYSNGFNDFKSGYAEFTMTFFDDRKSTILNEIREMYSDKDMKKTCKYINDYKEIDIIDIIAEMGKILEGKVTPTQLTIDYTMQLAKELDVEINHRELTVDEKQIFEHIENVQADVNLIENAIHPDFPYLKELEGDKRHWKNTQDYRRI